MLLAGSSRAAGVARAVPLLYPAPRGDTVVCTDTLSPSSHIMYTPPPSSLTYPRTCIYEHMHIHVYAYRELGHVRNGHVDATGVVCPFS